MKYILPVFLLCCTLLPTRTSAQIPDSLKACLDSALTVASRISLYRNTVDWKTVEAQVRWRSSLAQDVLELRPVFQYILEQLKDSHGRFFFQNRPIAWYHGELKEHQQEIDPKVWGAIQSGTYPFQYALLPGRTGYLRLTGMPMGDNAQLAAPIQAAICEMLEQGARQWIVDLRYNGGGNMHPMLAGLAALLGEGEVGGSLDGTGNRFSTWSISNGDAYYNGYLQADMDNLCPLDTFPPVAVLTSPYTVSSGEIVAVAFKGRPQTRFFGAPTGGFTTETNWVPLPAGVIMSISVSFFADRQGFVYKEFVPVDEEIKFVPDADPEDDPAIRRAIEWLETNANDK